MQSGKVAGSLFQSYQRCSSANESAPMIQTNRPRSSTWAKPSNVSAVHLEPSCRSTSLTTIRGWRTSARVSSILFAKSAVSSLLFNGFCGETNHQTASSCRRFRAADAVAKWPAWAGLNDPPNRPIRWPGENAGRRSTGVALLRLTRSGLAGAAHRVLETCKLFQSHRPAGMHLPGGNANLRAHAEFPAIGKLRGSIV